MADENGTNLWDHNHPYMCSESNYTCSGALCQYSSWEDFLEAWGDSDLDMNLVFRWDWEKADKESIRDARENGEATPPANVLKVFFLLQRKGHFVPTKTIVEESDQDAVRAWLSTRFEHLKTLWAGTLTPTQET